MSPTETRHETFTYTTEALWMSGRSGVVRAEGKPDLRVSSPPEFKGEKGRWTPEDFFVVAIDLCTMTTFADLAQRSQIPIVEYRSRAEGTLAHVGDGYRFTRVVLRPVITVAREDAVEAARKAIDEAHAECLVGRSVSATVTVEPRIEVVSGGRL